LISVFDSGIGGISVLAELKKILPQEDFCYFADAANAPYGDKETEEIKLLMRQNVQSFLDQGAKAVVPACNTATSAAAASLREEFCDIPILGIEPALKPALQKTEKKVLVLATALTIKEKKLHNLAESLGEQERLIMLPCSGLMEMTEENPFSEEVESYLQCLIKPYAEEISAIVLGCTHYSFLKPLLKRFFPAAELFDGNEGLARHLQKVLTEKELLQQNGGALLWQNSLSDEAANAAYNRHCEKVYNNFKSRE